MTLRARLVVVVVAVTAVGLLLSGIATNAALHSYLMQRVDRQLDGAVRVAQVQLTGTRGAAQSERPFFGNLIAARMAADGTVVDSRVHPLDSAAETLDALPPEVLSDARAGRVDRSDAHIAGVDYRVLAEPVEGSTDVVVVMAADGDVAETVARLRLLELVAAAGLLVVATIAATWLVRVGLRPLVEMADTADAIAGGEVERRVAASGGREVEHLATALNGAFDVRQASEERLRRFVADASHELRTPLSTIRGYAELQRSGALNDPVAAARAARRIEEEAARMGVLVDDLILLSRLDEGRPLRRELVDLRALAADAIADARAVDPGRPLEFDGPEPVLTLGDYDRVLQAVGNLLANVREHTRAGTPCTVTVGAVDGWAVVSVADEGPGIDGPTREHMFDRFWRADPARGHRPGVAGGSGLGLAIVQGVVTAHGGKVEATGEPGAGTTVTIRLPLAPVTNEMSEAEDPQLI
jgi:two-component system OmpR family sensor kinase